MLDVVVVAMFFVLLALVSAFIPSSTASRYQHHKLIQVTLARPCSSCCSL